MPKVSILIPAYNRGYCLKDALDSVAAQTYQDFEVIVVDDGSSDETSQVVKSHPLDIQYIYQKNKGVAAARNAGMAKMTGEYLAFLDSDDMWLPKKLEIQLDFLNRHPEVDVLGTRCEVVGSSGESLGKYKPTGFFTADFEGLLKANFLITSTVMMRTRILKDVGYFSEEIRSGEDYEFFLRVTLKGRAGYIEDALTKYRISKDGETRDMLPFYQNGVRYYKKLYPLLSEDQMRLIREKQKECYWMLSQGYRQRGNFWGYLKNYFLSKTFNLSQFN